MKSLQITVELLDGTPHGVRRSKIQHRQARAIAITRDQLIRMTEFDEFNKPGIYFLVGSVQAGPTIYVGQTDKLSDRLRQHGRERQDWKELVAITSSDDWMNIAHARCLESRCWSNCQENRYFVLNQQGPKEPQVSEQDRGFLEEFFEHMICLTRSLGYDFLSLNVSPSQKAKTLETVKSSGKVRNLPGTALPDIFVNLDPPSSKPSMTPSPTSHFDPGRTNPVVVCTRCSSLSATLQCFPGKYILKAGVVIRELRPAAQTWAKATIARREEYLRDGSLSRTANGMRLERDLTFKSPSMAANFVLGGNSNGWLDWKDESGQQLQVHRHLLDTE